MERYHCHHVPEETAKQWLIKQALWQIYFPKL